jgi:hypothetical protein
MQENTGQKIKDSGHGTAEGTGLWRIGHRAHQKARLRRIRTSGAGGHNTEKNMNSVPHE